MPSDIPLSNPAVAPSDIQAITGTLRSTPPTGSDCRAELEDAIAASTGCEYAVAVASSEQALSTLLAAMGLGSGHEIVLPSLGDAACLRATKRIGATPRFAECDPGTLIPTASTIEAVATSATGAILAGHSDGWGTGLPDIATACGRLEIPLIELVSTRLGSRCAAAPAGSIGRAAIVDLSERGLISGGEGAAIVTNDAHLAEACRGDAFITSGNPHRADPMPEFAAALALAQLNRLAKIIDACTAVAERYTVCLSSMPELLLPAMTPEVKSSWSRYVIRLDETFGAEDRDEIIRGMQRHDIQAEIGLAHLPTLWNASSEIDCPIAASIASRTIALPIHADLTHRDIDLICQTLQLMVQRATFRRG
ncbi:MAG: DegT/DnrJ/EryC1/StrS family aminotransferase [Phycisphaerales bacterium]|nr:DegT/DnrJ/EryC1/StrS family aminotransferase [Phycisphaerales bacterium]